ncbi:10239_t:CDS:2, partial [Racocetra persica]
MENVEFPTPLSRIYYSVALKDNLIFYIGEEGEIIVYDLNETTRGDSIAARYRHSAVLTRYGLIVIYGGLGVNNNQPQPN